MFSYSVFSLAIDSEIELPELPPGSGPPDVVIRLGSVPRTRRKATLGEEFAFNRVAGAFHITGGREIVVDPLPGVDPGAVRVILLGRVMAFLLRQLGWLPLHASTVVIDGRAALFLGASGSGKSTTAAAFHSRGHLVIGDDVAPVRVTGTQCIVRPAWPQLRLLDDSRELLAGMKLRTEFQIDKHTVGLPGGELRRFFPVWRIFALDYGSEIRTEVMPPLTAVALFSVHSFIRRPKVMPEVIEAHLRECASLADIMPIHRLERPKSLWVLPDLVRFLEQQAADGEPIAAVKTCE